MAYVITSNDVLLNKQARPRPNLQRSHASMNRAIQADVTNKHAYRNISLLLTHGFHHHQINNDYNNSPSSRSFGGLPTPPRPRPATSPSAHPTTTRCPRATTPPCYRPLSPPSDHVFVRAGSYAIDWLALLLPRSLAASTACWKLATG